MGAVAVSGINGMQADKLMHVRFVGSLNGCYTLSSRRGQGERVEVLGCRVLSISPHEVVVLAPVAGAVDEHLTAHIDGVGILHGKILRNVADGFAFDIEADDEARLALGAKIKWLKGRAVHSEHDRREHKRLLPRDARSTVAFPDGTILNCVLIDISRSGAAVSADVIPAPGGRVLVGRVLGRVVRPVRGGFAVHFDDVLPEEGFEKRLSGYEVKTGAVSPRADSVHP